MSRTQKFVLQYSLVFGLFYASYGPIRSFISSVLVQNGFSYTQAGIITCTHMLATFAANTGMLYAAAFSSLFAFASYSISGIYFTNGAVEPHNRLLAQNLVMSMSEVGYTIAGLTGALILDHSDIHTLLLTASAMSLIGGGMAFTAIRHFLKNRQPEA